ncbi:unnamed protein product, partial [Mesorhabditis spiculigera]
MAADKAKSAKYSDEEEDVEDLFDDASDTKAEDEDDAEDLYDPKEAFPVDSDRGDVKVGSAPQKRKKKSCDYQKPKRIVHKDSIPLAANVCQLCGGRLAPGRDQTQTTITLVHHSMAHLDFRPFQCSECNFMAARRQSITLHRKKQHNQEGSHIDHRTAIYYAKLKLMSMTNFPLQMKDIERYVDNQLARFNESLSIHLDEEREVEKNQCQLCGKKITLQKDPCINTICIMQHSMIHIDHKPFKCPQCGMASRAKDEIRKHQLRQHKQAEEVVDDRTTLYFSDLINMAKSNFPLQTEELEVRIEFVKSKLREFGPIKDKPDLPEKPPQRQRGSTSRPRPVAAISTPDVAEPPVKRRRSQRARKNNDSLQDFYKEFGLDDVSPIKEPEAPRPSPSRAAKAVPPPDKPAEPSPMDLLNMINEDFKASPVKRRSPKKEKLAAQTTPPGPSRNGATTKTATTSPAKDRASIDAIDRLKRMLEATEDNVPFQDDQQEQVDVLMQLFGQPQASSEADE